MTNNDLPTDDHIVRYVKPSMIQEDGTADGSDFRLRPQRPDESGLSVNWLEAFRLGKANQLAEVRRLCRLTIKPRGRFAEMNVDTVTRRAALELCALRFVHAPLETGHGYEADPSHAEIIGLPPSESDFAMLIGDLIAECVFAMHAAIIQPDLT